MSCFKFNLILLALSSFVLNSNAFAQKFNSKQCLDAKFNTSIKNEGKFFGLIKNDLTIKKSQCIINVTYKNILETNWLIDICREPIHIKVTSKGSQSVYKRIETCDQNKNQDYCTFWRELNETLQDYGLIFAAGERENLQSSHGQTYCTYLLIKRYLEDGYLFSKYDLPKNIFGEPDTVSFSDRSYESLKASNPSASGASASPSPSPSPVLSPTSEIPDETMEHKADEILEDTAKF